MAARVDLVELREVGRGARRTGQLDEDRGASTEGGAARAPLGRPGPVASSPEQEADTYPVALASAAARPRALAKRASPDPAAAAGRVDAARWAERRGRRAATAAAVGRAVAVVVCRRRARRPHEVDVARRDRRQVGPRRRGGHRPEGRLGRRGGLEVLVEGGQPPEPCFRDASTAAAAPRLSAADAHATTLRTFCATAEAKSDYVMDREEERRVWSSVRLQCGRVREGGGGLGGGVQSLSVWLASPSSSDLGRRRDTTGVSSRPV